MKKLRVEVADRLRLDLAEAIEVLGEESVRGLRKSFEHDNYMWHKLRQMGYQPGREPRHLVTWTAEDEGRVLSLPRGGTDRLRDACAREGVRIAWRDLRVDGDPELAAAIPEHRIVRDGLVVELWPHQGEAIDAIVARENCFVRSPTGSGKTSLLLALVARIKRATIIIVGSDALRDQWRERCVAELRFEPGIIQGPKRVLRAVTIAMRQTLDRHGVDDELKKTFGCVLVDEMQVSPAQRTYDIIDAFPARFKIGVSADERRVDKKECLSVDLFGKLVADIPNDVLIETGVVVPVEVVAVPTDFRAEWMSAEQSFLNDARSGEISRDYNRFLDELSADDERNALILRLARREIASGGQVIIFTLRVAHALLLRKQIVDAGMPCGLLIGDQRREFAEAVAGMRDGSLRVGVGTAQASGTGIDLPSVATGILALPVGRENSFLFVQVRGRLCRSARGKTSARLYVPVDVAVTGNAGLRLLQKWNGNGSTVVLDRSLGQEIPVTDYIRRPRKKTLQK